MIILGLIAKVDHQRLTEIINDILVVHGRKLMGFGTLLSLSTAVDVEINKEAALVKQQE